MPIGRRRRLHLLVSGALAFPLLAVPGASEVSPRAVLAHAKGIWSLPPQGDDRRWIVLHRLAEATEQSVLHLEVLSRREGEPAWKVTHVVDHMAATVAAVAAAVVEPLASGAVYPERFDDAKRRWEERAAKGDAEICSTSVLDCMDESLRAGHASGTSR